MIADSTQAKLQIGVDELKVLVAEDNPVNVFLITELLQSLYPKARLFTAENGEDAIKTFCAQRPHIIFMDLKMPGMDGIEACQAIRKIEAEKPAVINIPIFALTACSLSKEREDCMQAGMNGVICKPGTIETIKSAIERYILIEEDKDLVEKTIAMGASPGKDALHFESDKLLKRIFGDQKLLIELIEIASAQISQNLDALEIAVTACDSKQIRHYAHSIRGSALNMSLPQLTAICEDLERNPEADAGMQLALVQAARSEFAEICKMWSEYS